MNLATNLERSAFFFPERPAISQSGNEISYSQLNEKSNWVATGLLNLGVKGIETIISNHGDIALSNLYEKGSKNFRAVKRDRRGS